MNVESSWSELKLIDSGGGQVAKIEVGSDTKLDLGTTVYSSLKASTRKGLLGMWDRYQQRKLVEDIASGSKRQVEQINDKNVKTVGEAVIKDWEALKLWELTGIGEKPKSSIDYQVDTDTGKMTYIWRGEGEEPKAIGAGLLKLNEEIVAFQEYASTKIAEGFVLRGKDHGNFDQTGILLDEIFGLTSGKALGTIYEGVTGLGKTDVVMPMITALRAEFFGEVQTVLFPTTTLMEQFSKVAAEGVLAT